jgi:NAD(P)-dependent dehydrogenase (short-subunit alcohol dehydrogenase family)
MSHRRVAIISGASRGLGLETARLLGERGFDLAMVARGVDALQRAAAQIARDTGIEPLAVAADVTDARSVHALAEQVAGRYGRADVLVNNAGVLLGPKDFAAPEAASVLRADPDQAVATFAANVAGPLRMVQAFVPMMRVQRWGRIVNVSSGMGQLSDMGGFWPAYRMSKTALNALTKILAVELHGSGIKVNSVCPGWCRTDMGGPDASRSAAEGAKSIAWAALIDDDGPSGGFFRDGQPLDW